MQWTFVDGPDTPNGWVKIIYWDKGGCMDYTGEDALYALHGGFGYIIHLPDKKGPVPKGMNDISVDEVLAEYQKRKNSIRAPLQEVKLAMGIGQWDGSHSWE